MIAAAVHAPFGIEILKRGIVFIDLATAQVVGLALILLGMWLEEPSWMARQAAAFGAGVAAALFCCIRSLVARKCFARPATMSGCSPNSGSSMHTTGSGQVVRDVRVAGSPVGAGSREEARAIPHEVVRPKARPKNLANAIRVLRFLGRR